LGKKKKAKLKAVLNNYLFNNDNNQPGPFRMQNQAPAIPETDEQILEKFQYAKRVEFQFNVLPINLNESPEVYLPSNSMSCNEILMKSKMHWHMIFVSFPSFLVLPFFAKLSFLDSSQWQV